MYVRLSGTNKNIPAFHHIFNASFHDVFAQFLHREPIFFFKQGISNIPTCCIIPTIAHVIFFMLNAKI